MSPVPIERARVLELGCASGGNLVPMADQFPEAMLRGLDMSIRQIQDGHYIISKVLGPQRPNRVLDASRLRWIV
jgi:trans-aconitate methyltransferase